MRQEKIIDLGDERNVVVKELRPRDVRKFLDILPDELEKVEIRSLLTTHLPKLVGLLEGECILPPKEEKLEDLSFSELREVWNSFEEMHKDFFAPLRSFGLMALKTTAKTLTKPASP